MSYLGERLRAWGPHRIGKDPDVDGTITEVVDDQRVQVKEERYDTTTTVKIDGGWFLLMIGGIVVVGLESFKP